MIDLIRRSGYEPTMKVIESTVCTLDNETCLSMEIPEGTEGYKFSTIYSATGIPFVHTVEFVPKYILPETLAYQREDSEDLADFITKTHHQSTDRHPSPDSRGSFPPRS